MQFLKGVIFSISKKFFANCNIWHVKKNSLDIDKMITLKYDVVLPVVSPGNIGIIYYIVRRTPLL